MNPFLLAVIVVVNAAIFTYFDAARLRDSHHVGVGPKGIAPHAWASLVFLFLPLALPYYLSIRGAATSAALREGPPPSFTARDLNVWGYVSAVGFLAAAVYLGLVGQFHWAAMAALGMIAGLFGGRKAVQVGESGREFDLGGAAWDMSAFRPVDDEERDDEDVLVSGAGAYIPPVAGPGGQVQPGIATAHAPASAQSGGAGLDVFAPPRRPPEGSSQPTPAPTSDQPPTPRPIVADAAPPLALSAIEDDEDVWDPLRADEEAQRAREGQSAASPVEPPAPPASPAAPSAAPQPPAPQPPAPQPPGPQPATPQPAAPQPAAPEPLYPTPSPAQTQPLSALPVPPTPPSAQAPVPPSAPETPSMTLGEELPPGLVDDEEPSLLIDDDLAPFELAPDAPEEDLVVEPMDDGDDEDLELLAPLPPVATPVRRPPPRAGAAAAAPATADPPGSMAPPTPRPASSPTREDARPRRPTPPPVGGYAGQAKSSAIPPVLIWFAVIAAMLGAAWWIGSRDDGEIAEPIAEAGVETSEVESVPEPAESAEEPSPAASRAAAAEEAMRRQMNDWISTYDTVMRPIAELVEQIDFSALQQGSCLELQRQAEKANRQLKVAPDEEVELLLRPAFESFLNAGLACSGGNETDWSIHLLQAKDHTHETQILLDERYRYVGPFELEQEGALGHQRSLETISGRYLAGELEAQSGDDF